MTVAVLGDVQAGPVAAYAAAVSGRPVHLLRPEASPVTEVEAGGVSRPVEVIRTDSLPGEPLDAVIVVAQSRHLRELLQPLASRLGGVPLLLAPGGFAGALRVSAWFQEWGLEAPMVAEATGFPVSGTTDGHLLRTRILKRAMPMASVDADATAYLHKVFVRLLPELTPSDLVTTSLSNTNHMIHPGVVLLNAARIDNAEAFIFYREGISPAVGRLLETVDAERVELARLLGAQPLGVRDWMIRFYGQEGMSGAGIAECLQGFASFAQGLGPTSLDYRYLVDDIPFGLGQWAGLAADVGLATPSMNALLTTLTACAPDLNLGADPEAAMLFRQFHTTTQGVPA